jgi:hypothetical protein
MSSISSSLPPVTHTPPAPPAQPPKPPASSDKDGDAKPGKVDSDRGKTVDVDA